MRRLAAIALLIFLGLLFTFYHPSHALVEDSDELFVRTDVSSLQIPLRSPLEYCLQVRVNVY